MHLNIASYATTIPTLLLWIVILIRMLIQKAKAKFFALIVICILMIVSQITAILQNQLSYNFYNRIYKEVLSHQKLDHQILQGFENISYATFNLAHWLFAFSYLVLSYRVELSVKRLPEDIHNCRLNAANVFVCLLNVALPLICWVFNIRKKYKIANITFDIEQMLLVLSCIILIWGIARLSRIQKDLSNMLVNKSMLVSHVVAYLFIVVVNIVQCSKS